jgi:hypothetical protein
MMTYLQVERDIFRFYYLYQKLFALIACRTVSQNQYTVFVYQLH